MWRASEKTDFRDIRMYPAEEIQYKLQSTEALLVEPIANSSMDVCQYQRKDLRPNISEKQMIWRERHWTQNHRTDEDIDIIHRIKNYNKHTLKVVMFERIPTAIQRIDGYEGVDGQLIESLADALNFKLEYIDPGAYRYGKVFTNGSSTGSLAAIVNDEADITGNGLFLMDYGTRKVKFTVPHSNDDICFVVPKAAKIPRWIKPVEVFNGSTWIALGFASLSLAFVWYIIILYEGKFSTNWLHMFGIFTSRTVNLPTPSVKEKIILTLSLFFILIITGIFQGALTTSLSVKSFSSEINTLEDLYKSKLSISTTLNLFHNESGIMHKFAKKQTQPTKGSLYTAAYDKTVAAVERRSDAKFYIETQFVDDDGTPLLSLLHDCIFSRYIAHIVPYDSPFLRDFNYVIRIFIETGFVEKWHRDAIHKQTIKNMYKRIMHTTSVSDPFTLQDVQLAFFVLIGGLMCLKDMEIKVPEGVKVGDTVTLACHYDLETAPLYTIKWYRYDEEFYRYVPKESPPFKVFVQDNLVVDISRSNSQEVTLTNVERETSGLFRCEVTADAPLFHTQILSAPLVVSVVPDENPILKTQTDRISPGSTLKATCTTPGSYPRMNVTWFVDGTKIHSSHNVQIDEEVLLFESLPGLESVKSTIAIRNTPNLFRNGKIKLACLAAMHPFYRKLMSTEIYERTSQLALVMDSVTNEAVGSRINVGLEEVYFSVLLLLAFNK